MSGIIFVVLAIGWAVYLLPKALKRHDDLDRSRPVEEFSDAVRVLGRGVAPAMPAPSVAPVDTLAPVPTISREAARSAARRRRRVLALLLTTLVAVTATSALGYTPWIATAVPGGLFVAFLVVARLSVRAQHARRVAPVQRSSVEPSSSLEAVETLHEVPSIEADLGVEDTVGVSARALAEAVAQGPAGPVLDDGGLWDPLPVTLPTYVTKARARRTVRTIEITSAAGITSSGHDAADSALAAEAREAEQQAVSSSAEADIATPKAAGA